MNLFLSFRKVIVLLIIVVTLPLSLHSEELTNKELNDRIKEAQAYFNEQDYDSAILILTEVVENNPDRLDQAVDLMDKITEIRNQYNEKYRDLLTALYEDEDPKRALELIEEMEALEKNPNEVAKQALRTARISMELIYNKIRLREIMDEAKIQLDFHEYNNALVLYETGFELGKQTYDESSLVTEIDKSIVYRAIDEIYKGALNYLETGKELVGGVNSIKLSINSSTSEGLETSLATLVGIFNKYSAERSVFSSKSNLIDENLKIIVASDKNAPERFFLDFARFLLNGRNDVEFFEGIISTTDIFWEEQFLSLADQMDLRMNESYKAAMIAYQSGSLDLSELYLEDTLNYARYNISIYEMLNKRINLDASLNPDEYSASLIEKFYGNLVDARINARVTDSYSKMIELRRKLEGYEVLDVESIEDLYDLRLKLVADLPLLDAEESLWRTIGDSIDWLEGYQAFSESAEDISQLVRVDLSSMKNEMKRMNLDILTRLTDEEYKRITSELAAYVDDFTGYRTLIDGIIDDEVVAYTGDDLLMSTFPDLALPNLIELLENLSILINDTQNIIDTFKNSDLEITENSEIQEFLVKTELILPRISELSEQVDEEEILARDNIFKADGYENQGNKLLDTVRSIVNSSRADRASYDRARESLKDANNAFYQSFSFQEDLELRINVDEDLASLQQALLDGENRLVVADVRIYINQGKEAYVNRQYTRSRVLLERAQNRWLTTNSEEHPEVQYWMALVDLALQFDRGRSISKTEPLYDEMTQFLNLAYGNFNKGVNLLSRGERDSGVEILNQAIENIENVEIYMPRNESASLLRLRIAQLIDPEQFKANFSNRIDDAWEKLQSSNKSTQGEGYVELIDLSKIDSKYPGLQNKITRAEYDILKTRKRPPNPADLRESITLYGQALVIVENNVRAQFEIALTWLNQAIALNPDNAQAISLKDRIQIEGGGQATIVLPTALENRFREAQELYEQANYLSAYTIILELKKDSRSANYSPLLKLEERVKLKLQI